MDQHVPPTNSICCTFFELTDRLETRQQTPVLLLSNCCCSFQRECCLLVLNSVTSTPQWIRQPERVCVCVVFVCKYVLGHSRVSQPLNLRLCLLRHFAFSLRRMPPRPAADVALPRTGSSAALHPDPLPIHGPISFTFLPRPDLHYIHRL